MPDTSRRLHWGAFAVVIAGYLSVTVAESILAPLFPSVAEELGIGLATAGLSFALLTGAIAVGNLGGGLLVSRLGAKRALAVGLGVAAVGSALSALAPGIGVFLAGQAGIGLGAGIFFAPGIGAIREAAPPERHGLAMGLFGVAFSIGLTIAAFLAAAGAELGWRVAFWVAAVASLSAAVITWQAGIPDHGPRASSAVERRQGVSRGALLATPVAVGTVGTISQYGTVGFMAIYAVSEWGLSPATAALVIAAGRVLSIPGKVVIGMGADRWGSFRSLWIVSVSLVATGLWWTLMPLPEVAIPAAVVFAAGVSGLFPIANLMAVERFGGQGAMLGTYRSVQIALSSVAVWGIGTISEVAGLRPILAVSAVLPVVLLVLGRRPARRIAAA